MVDVPPEVIHGARVCQSKWGVPASVTIAQWAVEGAWGKSVPAGSNNPFGEMAPCKGPPVAPFLLDGTPQTPYVTIWTWEKLNGKKVRCQRPLMAFPDFAAGFDAHGKLLATGSAFGKARALLPRVGCPTEATVEAYTRVMADGGDGPGGLPGYATGDGYADLLISIMRGHDLYQYNSL